MTIRPFIRHIVSALCAGLSCSATAATRPTTAGPQPGDIVTYHGDNLRTGWNATETILTPMNVGGGGFGLLAQTALDEQVDAQPLYLGAQPIAGQGTHDVVYVATENNTVYAIDAESGRVLLSQNFGMPVPVTALPGQCGNNSNNMGINSTPVIDRSAGLLYVITYTYEQQTPVFRLHALSLSTLQDNVPPVPIASSARFRNGKAAAFVSANNRQRAGLIETSGNIYAGFASWCDINANVARGWVLGWNATTLAPLPVSQLFNRRPTSPDTFFLSSVWMSGYGIASDDNGSLFVVTGNSDYSGTSYNSTYNLAESVVKLSADLTTVQSFFTPDGGHVGWHVLDRTDGDFGSAGVLLLPPQAGSVPNLAVAAGKNGPTYLLNRDNLGGLGAPAATLGTVENDGCWCGQSYFVGADGLGRVVTSTGTTLRTYIVRTTPKPGLDLENSWPGLPNGQDPGFFTSISSNGTQAATALVWAVTRPTNLHPASVRLLAFDPTNTSGPMFSAVAGTWPFAGSANANLVPVVANGHVFVSSYGNLSIFGVLPPGARAKPFEAPPAPRQVAVPGAPHALHGVVTDIAGTTLTLRLRNGTARTVDFTAAGKAFQVAPPAIGHASLARGTYSPTGVFIASTILHQKDSQALWSADY